MGALYSAFLIPGAVVVGATLKMTDVKACTTGGSEVRGSLVGDTAERIYIGEQQLLGEEREDATDRESARRIIAVPYSKITQVLVGEYAFEQACDPALQQPSGEVG